MFKIKNADIEKYSIKNNPLAEKTDQLIKGFLQKQEEVLKETLATHGLTVQDIALHGEMRTNGDIKTLFYKGKPIAFFTKEEIKTDGNITTLSQKYKILK